MPKNSKLEVIGVGKQTGVNTGVAAQLETKDGSKALWEDTEVTLLFKGLVSEEQGALKHVSQQTGSLERNIQYSHLVRSQL